MSIQPVLLELDRVLEERSPLVYRHLRPGLDSRTVEKKLAIVDVSSQDLIDFYRWHNGVEWDSPIRFAKRWLFSGPRFLPNELTMACAHFYDWEELSGYRPQLKVATGGLFPMLWNAAASWLALNVDVNSAGFGGIYLIDLDVENQVRLVRPSIREFLKEIIQSLQNDTQVEI